jgi:hypothetical protein
MAPVPDGAPTVDVVEFHSSADSQYFITADSREIGLLDSGGLGGLVADRRVVLRVATGCVVG